MSHGSSQRRRATGISNDRSNHWACGERDINRYLRVRSGGQCQHLRGLNPVAGNIRRYRYLRNTLQWAVTGYSLVGAATIVTSGALGDVFGRRKIFLVGLLLFVASCVLIALSTTGGGVIAGRCIQGAAGSTILACGMSLISAANTGKAQLRAVTLWGAASAIGAAAGPLAGGFWRTPLAGKGCSGSMR
jgi:MFS family permease